LEEKRKKLKEDRENFDLNHGLYINTSLLPQNYPINHQLSDTSSSDFKQINTRKTTRLQASKQPEEYQRKEKRRKNANSAPSLTFSLHDSEIYEDLGIIRKAQRLK
jgi:hypothetical protein